MVMRFSKPGTTNDQRGPMNNSLSHTAPTTSVNIDGPNPTRAAATATAKTSGTVAYPTGIQGDASPRAATAVMAITSLLFTEVAIKSWRWKPAVAWSLACVFFAIDGAFLASNLLKIQHGGWYALAIAAIGSVVMMTWNEGTLLIGRRIAAQTGSIHEFLAQLWAEAIPRVRGTAVFMTPSTQAPFALVSFVRHAHVLHEQVVLLSIVPSDDPYVPDAERVTVQWMPDGFWSVTAEVGFMEQPDTQRILALAKDRGLPFEDADATYFARKMKVLPNGPAPIPRWRKSLFALLHSTAIPPT